MIKASLLIMLLLTVMVGMGLRWRQARMEASRQAAAPAPRGRRAAARPGFLARGKAGIDLWITAAAIASLVTILLMGGLHWIKVWLQ
ncbi:hypothetical protein BKE38_23995 [Pseudoroseomonas deserti]|uniref:Uncharacterized protein n=1 Tax=Teichococcus deserti TaxID=1817963 RepID=A0A1V2GWK1_9PROT|nr:hypothetical protein [Pseudoroseomonas deserti]ONG47310.1 hypothetical protein BKE38_23995 [Pseudoroseomonas deserti]